MIFLYPFKLNEILRLYDDAEDCLVGMGQKVLYVTLEAPDKDYAVDDEGTPNVIIA